MSLLQNSNAISTSGGYTINNSLRFRASASAYLSRTPSSAGNRQKWTWSGWVKRGALSSSSTLEIISAASASTTYDAFYFDKSTATLNFETSTSGIISTRFTTTQVFRDPSAWYHIVIAFDTTQATSSNRMKLYVNGVEITSFSTITYPTLNSNTYINSNISHRIADYAIGSNEFFDGYMTEQYFIDGQQLTLSSFGQTSTTTGVWQPKQYTGTYGTNGFYLKFSDIATTSGSNAGLGKDFSGNTNYWTTNNISVTSGTTYDAMIDSPTNASSGTQPVGNYAVLNPVATTTAGSVVDGNLKTSGADKRWYSSIGVDSGKWYWEWNIVSTNLGVGIGNNLNAQGTDLTGWLAYANTGLKYNASTSSSYGATYTANDVIGVALDMDAGTLVFYKNNVSQGTAFTGLTGIYYASCNTGASGVTCVNFGQRSFAYTPPTGYKALCTTNLPDSTIFQGNKYMDATTYTGTGATLSITNTAGFKPDFVWVKGRSGATDHALYDSVRGVTNDLVSNSYLAPTSQTTGLTAFNSNGFSVGSLAKMNTNAATYIGWQWQAGQGTTSSNTNGSITSDVCVNTSAGFSIISYQGTGANATVGHGLGIAPKMVIVRKTGGSFGSTLSNWAVWHTSLAGTEYLLLDLTSAKATGTTYWNSTTPTSTVFNVGTASQTNTNLNYYIAYCFAEIAGYSKFGSYTGNGSADGSFVYLGFRPSFILVKNTNSATQKWFIMDSTRNNFNLSSTQTLNPNSNAIEVTDVPVDFLSNGFKMRNTDTGLNGSANTMIFAAFAENPFKNALAR